MTSWSLFGVAWVSMVVAAMSLAVPGVMVVARGQIMLAIAASQSAACGAAAGMFLIAITNGGHIHGDMRIHIGALCGGLLGTGLAWQGGSERAGWLFAGASAGTVLLVAFSPYGMHDVMALQHSNALLATAVELVFFSVVALLTGVAWWLRHRELRLLAIDPEHAARCGVSRRRWDIIIGAWLGLVMSVAVSTFGLLFTFSALILPALVADRLSPALWLVWLLAPAVAAIATIGGIIIGHTTDVPPGQTVAALLAALCAGSVVLSRLWSLVRGRTQRSVSNPSPALDDHKANVS